MAWHLFLILVLAVALMTQAVADQTIIDFATTDLDKWSCSEGVTLERAPGDALINLPQWREGDNHWPLSGFDGSWDCSDWGSVVMEVHNPTDRKQMIQFTLRGVGDPDAGAVLVPAHQDGELVIDLTTPSRLDVSAVTSIVVSRTQPPFDQQMLLKRVLLRPAAEGVMTMRQRLTANVTEAAARLAKLGATEVPDAKRALVATRLPVLQADLKQAQEALAAYATQVCGRLHARLQATDRLVSAATALQLATGHDLLVWPDLPWRQARPGDMPPPEVGAVEALEMTVAGREVEDRVVNLTNVSGGTLTLLVREMPPLPLAGVLQCFAPTGVYGSDSALLLDALVPLAQSGTITIPDGETRQLWVRLNTRHSDLAPGKYTTKLQLLPLEAPALAREIGLQVERWPFELPAEAPLHVLVWDEMYEGRSRLVIGERYDEALRMLVEAGVNAFDLMPGDWPRPKFTPEGELAEPLDFTRHDQRVKFYQGHGQVFFCLSLDPGLWHDLKPGTDLWRKALASWLLPWRARLIELGLTPQDFALYLADEPNEERAETLYVDCGAEMRAIWPEVRLYFNGSALSDDPEQRRRLFAMTDIVQPELSAIQDTEPGWLKVLQTEVREPWFYACSGTLAGSQNVYDYYLLQAWKAVAWKLKGIGFWSFCAGTNGDPWAGANAKSRGYTVVYEGPSGLMPSRRWAAYEEGIEGAKLCALVSAQGDEGVKLVAAASADIIAHPADMARLASWRTRLGSFLSGQ